MELNIEIYPAKEYSLEIINAIDRQLRSLKKSHAIAEYRFFIKTTPQKDQYTLLSEELEEEQEIEIVEEPEG